jgi:hypothetical protein
MPQHVTASHHTYSRLARISQSPPGPDKGNHPHQRTRRAGPANGTACVRRALTSPTRQSMRQAAAALEEFTVELSPGMTAHVAAG